VAAEIDSVGGRAKLKPRHDPYYARLSKGCYLGFRKMTATTCGTWVARYRSEETKDQQKRTLGSFEHRPPVERFDAAKKEAESWFRHLGMGGTSETVTVRIACERYIDHVRLHKGEAAASDIEARFERWVYADKKFAETELPKLARGRVEMWRKNVAKTSVQVNHDNKNPVTRARAASTVNRDMTPLRAALNHAHDGGHVASDIAWRVALRPAKNADGRRDVYLDRDQRRRLIKSARDDVSLFLTGLSLVPLRPGALAALSVGHLDKRLGVLTIGRDKAGRDRRIKLPENTGALFAALSKDKLPAAPLFCRADGKRWDKDAWKGPIKEAASKSQLPASTTAYAMRHSVITDLVTGGLDLLTAAQLSGTSIAMIERHYGHLRADRAAAALATLEL